MYLYCTCDLRTQPAILLGTHLGKEPFHSPKPQHVTSYLIFSVDKAHSTVWLLQNGTLFSETSVGWQVLQQGHKDLVIKIQHIF